MPVVQAQTPVADLQFSHVLLVPETSFIRVQCLLIRRQDEEIKC